jgi:hypothetical protein
LGGVALVICGLVVFIVVSATGDPVEVSTGFKLDGLSSNDSVLVLVLFPNILSNIP